jgi:hypothetical protein
MGGGEGGQTHPIRMRKRPPVDTVTRRILPVLGEPRDISVANSPLRTVLKGRSQCSISRAFCTYHIRQHCCLYPPTKGELAAAHYSSEPAPTVSACAAWYAAKFGPACGSFCPAFPPPARQTRRDGVRHHSLGRIAHWCRGRVVISFTRWLVSGVGCRCWRRQAKNRNVAEERKEKGLLDAFGFM